MLVALVIGFSMGFLGSIPIAGPVAAMVLERAAGNRAREARAIAIGAAIAESGYALLAFWGWTTVLSRFPKLLPASRILGAAVFIVLGLYFLLRRHKHDRSTHDRSSGSSKWLLGFSVTALNPTLIVTWTTVIAALHSTGLSPTAPIDALPFAGGVGAGVIVWFWTLLGIVRHFRERVHPEWIDGGVKAMGGLFVLVGVAVGARILWTASR
jgi:threonine/homoserine/homoserine lactone efflux protein